MTCGLAQERLALALYGELSFDEEEQFEEHLSACAACRIAYQRERTLHALLDREALEPSADLLRESRLSLRAELSAVKGQEQGLARPRWWEDWLVPLREGWAPLHSLARPVSALALVAVGFGLAHLMPVAPPQSGPVTAGFVPTASRVRYVEPASGGQVRIMVEDTRQRVLAGDPEEEGILRLLLAAAKDPGDPGLRVESMEILKSQPEVGEVRGALLAALQHDPNPGVRLKALEGLRLFAREANTRKVLTQVLLLDDNAGVRTQAIDLLTPQKEPSLAGVYQQLLQQEDNDYIRQRCQKALREMRASVETY